MRHLLFVFLLPVVGCGWFWKVENQPVDPNYPCGPYGAYCDNGNCCLEGNICGNGTTCPVGMCCYTGEDVVLGAKHQPTKQKSK